MRPERAVAGIIIKTALIMAIIYIFYAVAISLQDSGQGPVGDRGLIGRVVSFFRKGMHVKAPYISEEELRGKVGRYIK